MDLFSPENTLHIYIYVACSYYLSANVLPNEFTGSAPFSMHSPVLYGITDI
jgi:hypothetical protein